MAFEFGGYGAALLGGGLIGLSAVMLMAVQNRIAGVSGIVGGALEARANDLAWRVFFALGLIAGVLLAWRMGIVERPTALRIELPWLLASGLLVGVGTAVSSGCTSGHGVCGIARGSGRSIVATLTFMAFGVLTVWLMKSFLAR
jgi:uncharacterized protein